jgi:hypothetical protein
MWGIKVWYAMKIHIYITEKTIERRGNNGEYHNEDFIGIWSSFWAPN